jgi:DNA repair exonuclease SbcCD ATPase subunit
MRETLQNNPTLPRVAQQELRRASNEMTGSSNDLRQENAEMAAAKGRRALDRLKELQEMLQQNQDASLRKEMDELDEQFRNLTQEQKGLTEELQEMAKEDSADGQRLESARQTQEKLTRDMQQAMDELDQLAESSRRSQNEIARDMKELSEELRRSGIGERMEQAERHIEKQQLDAALQAEKDIQNRLEKTGDQLVKLRSQLAESEEEKLSVALDQTRRLREEIEALQAKSNEQKDNQQGGSSGDRGQMEPKDFQRLSEELSKRLDDLEFIERTIQVDSSLSRRAGQLGERWRGVVRNYNGQGEKDRFHIIEQYVLDPLKRFEAELAQKLELTRNTEKLFLVRDERVPPVYKELVDKYYESLSKAESN